MCAWSFAEFYLEEALYIFHPHLQTEFHLKVWPVTQASHYLTQAISVALQQDRLVSCKEELNYRVTHKIGHLFILVAVTLTGAVNEDQQLIRTKHQVEFSGSFQLAK